MLLWLLYVHFFFLVWAFFGVFLEWSPSLFLLLLLATFVVGKKAKGLSLKWMPVLDYIKHNKHVCY